MDKKFWHEWFKFVLMLLGILIVWVGFIFVCDKVLHKSFEELRFLHYFIFIALIFKARNIFLKKIKKKEE